MRLGRATGNLTAITPVVIIVGLGSAPIFGLAAQGPAGPQAPRVFTFDEIGLIDAGTAKDYVIHPSGPVKLIDPMSFGFLTRTTPSFSRVRIEVTTVAGNQPAATIGCGAAKNVLVAGVFALEMRQPSNYLATAAAKEAKAGVMPPGAGPLRLALVHAKFSAALATQIPAKGQYLLVRAFPADAAGKCYGTSAAAFFAKFEQSTATKVELQSTPGPGSGPAGPPNVSASVRVVGYYPEIRPGLNCHYIIRGPVSDPAYKAILEYKKISTAPGTAFTLCEAEVKYAYSQLPAATRAKLTLQSILQWSAAKFNWTAAKFQALTAKLASPLAPVIGPKYAQLVGNGIFGQTPGAPLTGDFNMVADQGCEYLKQYVNDKMVEEGGSEEDTQKADSKLDSLCASLKDAAKAAGAPNDYLLVDHDFDPRNATLFLRASYKGNNGISPNARGGGRKVTLTIRSNGGAAPNAVGMNFPQTLLYQRVFDLPYGKPGEVITFPIALNPAANYGSMDWAVGYNAYAGARASSGGSSALDLKIMPPKAVQPPK